MDSSEAANETSGTWLEQAKFTGADLRGADLSDAWLGGCHFTDANLSAIDDGTGTLIPTKLSGAHLNLATFSEHMNMANIELVGAVLELVD